MKSLKIEYLPWYKSWMGLIGQKPHAVYFKTRFGLHTFGMQYPMDVVILDKNHVVRKIKENLQPNKFFFWNPVYNFVIELPQGVVKKRKMKVNKLLEISLLL